MRYKNWLKTWVLVLIVVPLAAACSPPDEELDAAEIALEEARAADAQAYAADAWSEAEQAMNAAQTEIDDQLEKSFFTRSYKESYQLVAEAEEKANAAREAAAEEKARARDEAEQVLETSSEALEDTRVQLTELAECSKPPKGFAKDLELLNGQIDGIEAEIDAAQVAFDSGDFYGTTDVAKAAEQELQTLSADMTNAKEKIGC